MSGHRLGGGKVHNGLDGCGAETVRTGLSGRALFATGVAITTLAAPANRATAQSSEMNHGANDPLPIEAVQTDAMLFPGFSQSFVKTEGVEVNGKMASGAFINVLVGGKGPPLLLIHGHPETHVAWHKVAAKLAETYTVVLTDMRGYGDSSKPDGGPDHIDYSKRVMGADQVQVMKALGFERFQAVGHDRGGRVLHFMMMDHPEAVERGVVLDIAPTDLMYEKTDKTFATKYFWWFFQIQQAPVPERFIWEQEAVNVSGQGLPCGHLIPEEDPDGLLEALGSFLKAT